jgi:hypothetical protein
LPCGVGVVADESDGLDPGLFALIDLEHQIDAVVRPIDDLGHHRNVETAVALINLENALHVGLDRGARQCTTVLGLDFLQQLLVLEPMIAFKGNLVDHRRLDHGDNQLAAGLVDADVLE